MSALQRFGFEGTDIRVIVDERGEPWFVARDVCAALGLVNGRDALTRLDQDGVGTTDVIDTMGRKQRASTINEPALYELIFQSRRPEALRFRRWVTREVLPAIVRTGQYAVDAANVSRRQLAQAVLEAEDARELAEARVRELEPRASAWSRMVEPAGDYSVCEAAQYASRNTGADVGERKLFDALAAWKWIVRERGEWRPYQAAIDRGVLARKIEPFQARDGRVFTRTQVRVTPKGLARIQERLESQIEAVA